MEGSEAAILLAGGLAAGVVNTLAGGGSLLTVPLLVLVGLPGTLANGSNRVGVLIQNAVAAWRFRAEGVSGFHDALPVLVPVCAGSLLGAYGIARVTDETFERLFGVLMLALLVPTLRRPAARADAPARTWSPAVRSITFLAIGLYGGAIQAGVGLVLVAALSRAGYDLVRANSIKVVVILVLTAIAVPVFVLAGQVAWAPAGVLAAGFALGGATGARIAVRGGERVIRPMLLLAVLALAGRMIGLY
ncbi:MAG: sulfite exporter TauE/SafE family protein [Myxococcota bacterium]|nr:sulfite exporter TauE/SafE family protein [Myxococcota bacterium]